MTDTPKTAPIETPAAPEMPVAAPPVAEPTPEATPDAKADDKPAADAK